MPRGREPEGEIALTMPNARRVTAPAGKRSSAPPLSNNPGHRGKAGEALG